MEGAVSVNGEVLLDPTAAVAPAAVLHYRRPGWAEKPAPAHLDILWWDAHLVAVHKPSGLQVLPAGPVHQRCALTLLRLFHERHKGELQGLPAPLHRLGRGTSGLLLCGCSAAARRQLSADFAEKDGGGGGQRRLRKVYRTLVAGLVAQDEAEVTVPIGRVPHPGVRGGLFAAVPPGSPGAKPSRSLYRVLHRDAAAGTTLVDVEIFTGRPHQIRIHMAAAGHPLVGDPLYAPGGLPWPTADAPCTADAPTASPAGAAGGAAVQPAARCPPGAAAAEGLPGCGGATGSAAGARAAMPGDCGYLLHSMVLEFTHPVTGQRVAATCEPPPQLRAPGAASGG